MLRLTLKEDSCSELMQETSINRKVNLTGLKRFALENLPTGPLRDDILSQPDEITPAEYLANCRVWQRLARVG
jgi:hypothetical protein